VLSCETLPRGRLKGNARAAVDSTQDRTSLPARGRAPAAGEGVVLLCRSRPSSRGAEFQPACALGANPKVPGLTVPRKIEKMGYKGVDTAELILEGVRIPASRVLDGLPARGSTR